MRCTYDSLKDEAKKDDVGIKNKLHPSWTSEADLPLQTRGDSGAAASDRDVIGYEH